MSAHTFSAPVGGTDEDWVAWANAVPVIVDLGLRCEALDADTTRFALDEVPLTRNPNGSVNGGLVAAALDQVAGVLSMRGVAEFQAVATASLHVTYERPSHVPLTFTGRVTKRGRTLVFVEIDVHDAAGRLTSGAKATMFLVPFSDEPELAV